MEFSRQSLNRKRAKDRTLGTTILFRNKKRHQQRRLRRNSQRWEKPREIGVMGKRWQEVIISVPFLDREKVCPFQSEEVLVLLCLSSFRGPSL